LKIYCLAINSVQPKSISSKFLL